MANHPLYKPVLLSFAAVGGAALLVRWFSAWRQSRAVVHWIIACEQAFGPLSALQRKGIILIVRAYQYYVSKHQLPYNQNQLAYILVTAWHECSIEPKREYRARPDKQPRLYQTQNRYWHSGYFGRGYVQLTWRSNYSDMSELFGVDFVNQPDLVLKPEYAALILVWGMMRGEFGHKLGRHIEGDRADFVNARRSVNGTDDAREIADHAERLLYYL